LAVDKKQAAQAARKSVKRISKFFFPHLTAVIPQRHASTNMPECAAKWRSKTSAITNARAQETALVPEIGARERISL
jgi:hypothetical protein